jgi:hypothetical protein
MNRNIPIKPVLAVLLVLLICFVFYRYALSPQLAQIRDLRDQVASAETKLATLQEVQRLQDAFLRQNESYATWINQMAQVTPVMFDQHEHTAFLLDLQAMGKASDISFTGIQIADASMGQGGAAETQPAEVKLAKTVGVTMNFTAKDYWTIRRFVETFRTKFKYIMVSSDVSVSHNELTGAGTGNPYSCTMTAWMVLSPDAAVAGAPAPAAPAPQTEGIQ